MVIYPQIKNIQKICLQKLSINLGNETKTGAQKQKFSHFEVDHVNKTTFLSIITPFLKPNYLTLF